MVTEEVVLGIDPAKRRLGFAATSWAGDPLEAWASDVPAGMDLYAHAELCMDELACRYAPTLIAVEANRYSAAAMPCGKASACAAAYDHGAVAALVELAITRRFPSAELWWVTPSEWQSIAEVPRVTHRALKDARMRRLQNLALLRGYAAEVGYQLPASPSGIPDVDAAAAACISLAGWRRATGDATG